jgi:hypothetical protein
MFHNIPINSRRIDGMQLLGDKFPSLTTRQLNEAYEFASKQGLTVGEIKKVVMENPNARKGESFIITFELNS